MNRCFGTRKLECCHSECSGGCTGPTNKDCVSCKNLKIVDNGQCIDSCPRNKTVDILTGELISSLDGMFQMENNCVRSCPSIFF